MKNIDVPATAMTDTYARQVLAVSAFGAAFGWLMNHHKWVDAADDSSGSMTQMVTLIETKCMRPYLRQVAAASMAALKGEHR